MGITLKDLFTSESAISSFREALNQRKLVTSHLLVQKKSIDGLNESILLSNHLDLTECILINGSEEKIQETGLFTKKLGNDLVSLRKQFTHA